jgi:hypothetical protein
MEFTICDIDRTIANNDKRKHQSAIDVAGKTLDYRHVVFDGYNIDHIFDSQEDIDRFHKIFISGKYIHLDEPLPYSSNVLRMVKILSCLIYLTGRHHSRQDSMKNETIKWLRKYGYPVPDDNNVYLFMKPNRHMPDEDYKKKIIPKILEKGKVICGIGDTPCDGKTYSKFGIKPILLATHHFKREELLDSGKDVIVVEDWCEMDNILFKLLRT